MLYKNKQNFLTRLSGSLCSPFAGLKVPVYIAQVRRIIARIHLSVAAQVRPIGAASDDAVDAERAVDMR